MKSRSPKMEKKYDAFISYSHSADAPLARTLEDRLEKWAKRLFGPRTASVFRDETSLTATPELWPTIAESLDASGHLILLASTAAAESPWVKKEICYWVTGGLCDKPEEFRMDLVDQERVQRFFLVLTDGEIKWDENQQDFEPTEKNAVPSILAGVYVNQPFWVDLRSMRKMDAKQLANHDGFTQSVAKLLAPIRGEPMESLMAKNDREQRRSLSIFRSLSIGMVVALILAGIGGWVGWDQWGKTVEALDRETQERRISNAREFVARSESIRRDSPVTAGLLSLHAHKLFLDAEQSVPFFVEDSLFKAFESVDGWGLGRNDGTVQVVSLGRDTLCVAGVVSNKLRFRDTASQTLASTSAIDIPPIKAPSLSFKPRLFSFSADRNQLAILGHSQDQELCIVGLSDSSVQSPLYTLPQVDEENSDLNPPSLPVFSDDGGALFFVDRTCHLQVFRRQPSNDWRHEMSVDLFPGMSENPMLRTVPHAFVGRHALVFAPASDGRHIKWLPLESPEEIMSLANIQKPNLNLVLTAREDFVYLNELNVGMPWSMWKWDAQKNELRERLIDKALIGPELRTAKILDVSISGQQVIARAVDKTYVYSDKDASVQDLGRSGWQGAQFLSERYVISKDASPAVKGEMTVIKLWDLESKKEPLESVKVTELDHWCWVIPGTNGTCFAVMDREEDSARSRVFDVESGKVQFRAEAPIAALHHSPDLSRLSDGDRYWDMSNPSQMQFSPQISMTGYEPGTTLHRIDDHTIVYQRSTKQDDGETQWVTSEEDLSLNLVTSSGTGQWISKQIGEAGVMFTRMCDQVVCIANARGLYFWSLDAGTQRRIGFMPLSLLGDMRVFDTQLCPSGGMAVVLTGAQQDDEIVHAIWLVTQAGGSPPVQLRELKDCFEVRIEWLTADVVAVSQGSFGRKADGTPDPEAHLEGTYTYRCTESSGQLSAEPIDKLDIGGQWIAISGDRKHACILSAGAQIEGDDLIGSVFSLSENGRLTVGASLSKQRGQLRVEDLDISDSGKWIAISGNSPAVFERKNDGTYVPIYLEAESDRIDEMTVSEQPDWALSYTSLSGKSRVELWHLGDGSPNGQRIRIGSLEGHGTRGRQLRTHFGERHVRFTSDLALANAGKLIMQIPLDTSKWLKKANRMAGRNLSDKEIREQLGDGRDIKPLRSDWPRPLSIDGWEGTH